MIALILFAASLPPCPKLSHGLYTPGACVESAARIKMGLFSYQQSEAYCLRDPTGTAWWYDHVYSHTWVKRSCKLFVKSYKPVREKSSN